MTVRSFLTALGCNPRHHGLALAAGMPISMGIGKHTNDHMVSAWLRDVGRRVATVIE
jgi:hypothetical protein